MAVLHTISCGGDILYRHICDSDIHSWAYQETSLAALVVW